MTKRVVLAQIGKFAFKMKEQVIVIREWDVYINWIGRVKKV